MKDTYIWGVELIALLMDDQGGITTDPNSETTQGTITNILMSLEITEEIVYF